MGAESAAKFHPNTPAGRRAEVEDWFNEPLPEELGHGTNDPDALAQAKAIYEAKLLPRPELVDRLQDDTNEAVAAVIEVATSDRELIDSFKPAGSIRHVTRSADVARELLHLLELDPNLITRLCIGDVRAPNFLKGSLRRVFKLADHYHEKIGNKVGHGYEVGGKGLEIARKMFFKFIDSHYGFSRIPGLMDTFTKQSSITNGGMGSLSIIASAMIHRAKEKGIHHRFVSPDNSFGTWKNIVKLVSEGRETGNKTLRTTQENLLHPSPDDIRNFYAQEENAIPEGGAIMETWCLTPVSNPGGTKVDPQMLKETIQEIINHNPNATIILDSVYIRTLKPEVAQELMGIFVENPELLEKIVFVESFSKSHGVCGEREGLFFTANEKLFKRIQNQNMTLFAGSGLQKSALLLALCTASDRENADFDRLHEFWAAERKGLYDYLMQPEFAHLFEPEQPHIVQEQLQDPLGLYVFLRTKPGITFKDVALATNHPIHHHIVGVEEKNMAGSTDATGHFIRFSVGTITEPTYSAPPTSRRRTRGQIIHGTASRTQAVLKN